MTASSKGPQVVGRVDENAGTVSVGVVHGGAFLPVASASLDYAKALGLDAKGEPETDEGSTEGGES